MANNRHTLKHKKELYYIFLIVVVGGILLLSIIGPGGLLELKEARLNLQQRKAHVDDLDLSNQQRMERIDDLKNDPEAIERIIREKGYGRDNEIIQQLPEDPGEDAKGVPEQE